MARPTPGYESYEQMAARLHVPLCSRVCWINDLNRHTEGWTDQVVVHWRPRSPVRVGIWRFLKLCAQAKLGSQHMRTAERLWLENVTAVDLGRQLGLRFPRSYADGDRARVRAELAKDPRQIGPDIKEAIVRWTQNQ